MAMVTRGGQMSFAIFMVPMNIDERASNAPPILPAAHARNSNSCGLPRPLLLRRMSHSED